MLSFPKSEQLKYGTLGAGLLGLLLRVLLYSTGIDRRGLLISTHWAQFALWILTAAVIGGIFCLRTWIPAPKKIRFSPSKFAAAGCLLAAVALVLTPSETPSGFSLEPVEPVLRYLAAAALLGIGWCRFSGHRPNFLMHVILCAYFGIRMVCRYRVWSVEPQLMHYFFQLGAHLSLTFAAYHFATMDAKMGDLKKLWYWGMGGIFFCAVSIADAPVLMLGMILWLCSNLKYPGVANG